MVFMLFIAEPGPESPHFGVISRGYAHIWVKADSEEDAERLSLAYMEQHCLKPISCELVCRSQDVRLQDLGPSESALYRRAEHYGIALDYIAAPVDGSGNLSGILPLP